MKQNKMRNVAVRTVNGPDIKAENGFGSPDTVNMRETTLEAGGQVLRYAFEPHSVTVLIVPVS